MASIFQTLTLSARALSPRVLFAATPSSVLSPFSRVLAATTTSTQQQQQQIRGMKVHSSVKKRCEHCKVRAGDA
ncbi:hypothetical protein LLEC1_02910 [Akanthomyces lecanii]|uniref:Ribosomal protein n=1 Tax=Cordyceps confragosa TaxID=2714763 RepID=A0A179IDR3_CORDF|nr:hypothetical protein LLEC1_02910 [Akanthomyces lecanii]